MCFEAYSKIEVVEFFKQSWAKPKTQHLSPNVIKMIEIFNQVTHWVAAAIVSEPTAKARATIVTALIKIANVKKYFL
jgi:hypothetical protein